MDIDDHIQPTILEKFIQEHEDIKFIRLLWIDFGRTLRCRVLTLRHLQSLAAEGAFHQVGRAYLCLQDDSCPIYEGDPTVVVGAFRILPDFRSLKRCSWVKGHASVQCYIGEGTATLGEPIPFKLCPRYALQKVISSAAAAGLRFRVGWELEFCVLERTEEGGRLCLLQSPPHQATAIRPLEHGMIPILDRIVQILEDEGIPINHYQSEGGKAQFELTMGHLPPMEAVDALVHAYQVVRAIHNEAGLVASFHPWCSNHGSGLHTHVSIDRNSELSPGIEDSFLAGMLGSLGAICAFGLPVPVSYKRVRADLCSSGRFVAWGTQNREVPLRKMGTAWWEVRCVDSLSHPFLFLASVLAAGINGVRKGMTLEVGDCTGMPHDLPCSRLGIISKSSR